jgi:two-component system NarL family sensor kinase
MPIRNWILFTVSGLLLLIVAGISYAFYYQFRLSLDQRVLLHLTSIKQLKRLQIEEYLASKWQDFDEKAVPAPITSDSLDLWEQYPESGTYDITFANPSGKILLLLIKRVEDKIATDTINDLRIQEILLERTGMGNSGESYLVGEDFHLRSQSRFDPEKPPYLNESRSETVRSGLKGNEGSGITKDYRGHPVYSSYMPIQFQNIKWLILSEMDTEEVMIPLVIMQRRLSLIAIGIFLLALIVSIILSERFSKPILAMQQHLDAMIHGDYSRNIQIKNYPEEIKVMFQELKDLKESLMGAIHFSTSIGNMDLDSDYHPANKTDVLGQSLLKMRDKLKEFRNQEQQHAVHTRKLLLDKQESEQKRLSMELHDGLGPLLTSLKLYIQNNISDSEEKTILKKQLDETIAEVRRMSYSLLPPTLEDFGIGKTLDNYIKQLNENTNLKLTFEDLTFGAESKITVSQSTHIFRICQELINNTIKHANAQSIRISLSEFDDLASLYYFDDGIGFRPDQVVQGSGLNNIQERTDILNGQLQMKFEPNRTIFEIDFPLHA